MDVAIGQRRRSVIIGDKSERPSDGRAVFLPHRASTGSAFVYWQPCCYQHRFDARHLWDGGCERWTGCSRNPASCLSQWSCWDCPETCHQTTWGEREESLNGRKWGKKTDRLTKHEPRDGETLGWRSGRGINNPWETGTLGRTDGVAVPWAFRLRPQATLGRGSTVT